MGRQGISFLKQASAGSGHRRESEAGSAFPVCDCEGSFGRGRNGRAFFYASVGGWDGRAGLRGGDRLFQFARAGPRFAGRVGFTRCFYV
jgi:hypothetical protein